jgi:hypothetical protein
MSHKVHAVIELRPHGAMLRCETLCGREYDVFEYNHRTRQLKLGKRRGHVDAIEPIVASEITCNSCQHVWRKIT